MVLGKKISVVIPCKNEERNIGPVIKAIPDYVDEVIVVDNNSTDRTVRRAQEAGARVIREGRKENGIGYGYAHITGLKYAEGDFIFAMDGDDTYPSYEIKNIVNRMIKENLDFVSCNRIPLRNRRAISLIRRLGIYILNLEVLILYGRLIRDILSGMWCVRKEAVPKLNLSMGDWNLSPEIKLSALVSKDVTFAEYHIDHFEREYEPSKQAIWRTGFSHFIYIIKRRFYQDSVFYKAVKGVKGLFRSFPQFGNVSLKRGAAT